MYNKNYQIDSLLLFSSTFHTSLLHSSTQSKKQIFISSLFFKINPNFCLFFARRGGKWVPSVKEREREKHRCLQQRKQETKTLVTYGSAKIRTFEGTLKKFISNTYEGMYLQVHVCMYVCMSCMYVMYVCHVCMYECMHMLYGMYKLICTLYKLYA